MLLLHSDALGSASAIVLPDAQYKIQIGILNIIICISRFSSSIGIYRGAIALPQPVGIGGGIGGGGWGSH